MAERIDAFTHVLPPAVIERLADVHPTEELRNFSGAAHLSDIDHRLEDMDDFGVDKQVINIGGAHFWRNVGPEQAIEATRFANDEIRRIADEHPDRFIPVGTLPYLTDEYVDEYTRCIENLDLAGVQIFSNIDGRPLDDQEFRPFFREVDASGQPLWIHPQLIQSYEWIDDYIDHKMIGWPFDTTLALSRLMFGGVMEECQDLRVISHHLGGMLPYIEERIRSFVQTRREDDMYVEDIGHISGSIETYFERIYGDTAIDSRRSEHTLRCGLDFFGADRMLFGTDYPLGPDKGRYWLENTIDTLDGMDIDQTTREKVFGGNIARLIDG